MDPLFLTPLLPPASAALCVYVRASVHVRVRASASLFNPLQIYDTLFFFHFLVSVQRLCHLHSTPFIRLFPLTTDYNSDGIYVAGKCKVTLLPPPPPPPAASSCSSCCLLSCGNKRLLPAARCSNISIFCFSSCIFSGDNLCVFTAAEMHDSASLLLSRAAPPRLRQMVHFGFSSRHKLNRG